MSTKEDYLAAYEACIGADRMSLGLSIIPDTILGDMEQVIILKKRIMELEELTRDTGDDSLYNVRRLRNEIRLKDEYIETLKECLKIANNSADDQMFQKREAQNELSTIKYKYDAQQ